MPYSVRTADVVIHLLKVKCLPELVYGLNACPLNATDNKSLNFFIFKTLAKVVDAFSQNIIFDAIGPSIFLW